MTDALVPRGTSIKIWPCWCNTKLSNQNTSSRQQLRGTVGGGHDLRDWTWCSGTGRVPVPVLPQTDLDGLLYLRFQLPLFVRWGGSALNGCQRVWKRDRTCVEDRRKSWFFLYRFAGLRMAYIFSVNDFAIRGHMCPPSLSRVLENLNAQVLDS